MAVSVLQPQWLPDAGQAEASADRLRALLHVLRGRPRHGHAVCVRAGRNDTRGRAPDNWNRAAAAAVACVADGRTAGTGGLVPTRKKAHWPWEARHSTASRHGQGALTSLSDPLFDGNVGHLRAAYLGYEIYILPE